MKTFAFNEKDITKTIRLYVVPYWVSYHLLDHFSTRQTAKTVGKCLQARFGVLYRIVTIELGFGKDRVTRYGLYISQEGQTRKARRAKQEAQEQADQEGGMNSKKKEEQLLSQIKVNQMKVHGKVPNDWFEGEKTTYKRKTGRFLINNKLANSIQETIGNCIILHPYPNKDGLYKVLRVIKNTTVTNFTLSPYMWNNIFYYSLQDNIFYGYEDVFDIEKLYCVKKPIIIGKNIVDRNGTILFKLKERKEYGILYLPPP